MAMHPTHTFAVIARDVRLTTTLRADDNGHWVATSPTVAVQVSPRSVGGFRELYRGFDHAVADQVVESTNLVLNG